MVPLFIVGFAAMSAMRTIGDMVVSGRSACSMPGSGRASVAGVKQVATYCLAIAMAAVGLGTSIKGLRPSA